MITREQFVLFLNNEISYTKQEILFHYMNHIKPDSITQEKVNDYATIANLAAGGQKGHNSILKGTMMIRKFNDAVNTAIDNLMIEFGIMQIKDSKGKHIRYN